MRELDRLKINDKVQHFSAYVVLGLLPQIAFKRRKSGIAAALLMILLGLALEEVQFFAPGRTPDPTDGVADCFGVICGLLLGLSSRFARLRPTEHGPAK
jgi:VanZ family protein